MKRLATLFTLVLMVSCMSQKRLAEECQKNFPCIDSDSVTFVIKTDTITDGRVDTIIIGKDTYHDDYYDYGTYNVVGCKSDIATECTPTVLVRYKTIAQTVEKRVQVRDSSYNYLCNTQIDSLRGVVLRQSKSFKEKDRWFNIWMWIAIGMTILFILALFSQSRNRG